MYDFSKQKMVGAALVAVLKRLNASTPYFQLPMAESFTCSRSPSGVRLPVLNIEVRDVAPIQPAAIVPVVGFGRRPAVRTGFAFALACITLFLPCLATSNNGPKAIVKLTLPGQPEPFGGAAVRVAGSELFALYWARGSEPNTADLMLVAFNVQSGKLLASRQLETAQITDSHPIAEMKMEVSRVGGKIICFSEIVQRGQPSDFALWTIDIADLSITSSLGPQKTTPMASGYGFTNQGNAVRFASFERDKRNQVTAATIWDASTADLKTVVSKETIHFDPIGFPGPVIGTGDVVWNHAHGEFGEYDLATGRKIRTLPSPGDQAESYPLGDGLLVAAQESVPSRKDWGGYLLRYGAGNAPIHSPTVTGCVLLPQGFTADQRYAVALCDGTKLNAFFDSYYTAKLEAVTFDLKSLAILAEVPLNRRYENTSLAIATDTEGVLEAISDHAGEVQILRITTAAQGGAAGSKPQ